MVAVLCGGVASAEVSKEVLDSISTPNEVETSIGTLRFLDGAPSPETAEEVFDFMYTARAMVPVSHRQQLDGLRVPGARPEARRSDGRGSARWPARSVQRRLVPFHQQPADGREVSLPAARIRRAGSRRIRCLPPENLPGLDLPAVLRQERGPSSTITSMRSSSTSPSRCSIR